MHGCIKNRQHKEGSFGQRAQGVELGSSAARSVVAAWRLTKRKPCGCQVQLATGVGCSWPAHQASPQAVAALAVGKSLQERGSYVHCGVCTCLTVVSVVIITCVIQRHTITFVFNARVMFSILLSVEALPLLIIACIW